MERLRGMSLKRAFFCISFVCLLTAFLLSAAAFAGCAAASSRMNSQGLMMYVREGDSTVQVKPLEGAEEVPVMVKVLSVLQLLLPVVFFLGAVIAADVIFYRVKLKQPLEELTRGADRIMQNDLEFQVNCHAGDELGQLCRAFETMRLELMKNSQSLWRQAEERKRLNAAFSHDLRNPLTVLKGSVKVMQKGLASPRLPAEVLEMTLEQMEEYVGRMEHYVEAMSRAGRLEEVECRRTPVEWVCLEGSVRENVRLLAMADSCPSRVVAEKGAPKTVWLDKELFFQVLDNLVANGARFAVKGIRVTLCLREMRLILRVEDDGPGFPETIRRKQGVPFLTEIPQDGSHLGMGIYICSLLTGKHGGKLTLTNTAAGGRAEASFDIYPGKPGD